MRQYKVFIVIIQVIINVQSMQCGFERISQPTSVFSRAYSGTGMFAPDALWLNPASLGSLSSFSSSIYYSPSPFQLPQLSNYGIVIAQQYDGCSIALGLQSFGFSLYRESAGSLCTAKMITDEFSAGMNIHLYHLTIAKYGTSLSAVLDFGAIYSITEQWNIGFAMHNVTASSFGVDDDIPQSLMTGISYRLDDQVVVNLDLVKDIRYELTYRAGMEFAPLEVITLRAGTDGVSGRLFGGIGIHINSILINYGVSAHPELGLTHSIGTTFSL